MNRGGFQSLHGCCQYEWTYKHVTNKFYIIWNINGDSAILVAILAPNINTTWYPIILTCQTFVYINQWFRDQTHWTIRDIIETHYGRGRVVAIYHKSNEEQQQWHFAANEVQLYSISRKDVWIFVRIGNDYNCLNICCYNSWCWWIICYCRSKWSAVLKYMCAYSLLIQRRQYPKYWDICEDDQLKFSTNDYSVSADHLNYYKSRHD